ncbi:MAG: Mini-ribonuclease 3 [Anaeromicrobium sp.]|jgi:ribonuclease-3 family protein|uniref:Mini-ribonuclease 3 n=1 Tax=Anaeromicrobium sp. TaxID=1929132 RepID=UPI0025D621DB|nr:ribonuclease III domain-containing protein [Anaeromicrobium sp.]MCT4594799.1 Mini-ribonuclease 3 [Anaeromicrobium sp.]
MGNDFLQSLNLEEKKENEVKFLNSLVLAHMGDAVYEVYIRQYVLHKYGGYVNNIHKKSTKFVKASAQARIVHGLRDEFSEEEWGVIKRGRNNKSSTVPKNANISDYKYATGFEALIGYLYLTNKKERIEEIILKGIDILEEE